MAELLTLRAYYHFLLNQARPSRDGFFGGPLLGEKILIQSQRLYVCTWKQSDLDRLYHVMREPRTHLYTQEDPWSREYTVDSDNGSRMKFRNTGDNTM